SGSDGSGGGSGGGGSGGDGSGDSGPGHVTSSNGSITIPGGWSGEVSLDDEIRVEVPAGASDETLVIDIEESSEPESGSADPGERISPIFDISKNTEGNFDKPVTVSIKVDPEDIGKDTAIYVYDEEEEQWVRA